MTASQPFNDGHPHDPTPSQGESADPGSRPGARPWLTSVTDPRTGIPVWIIESFGEGEPMGHARVHALPASEWFRAPVVVRTDNGPTYLSPALQRLHDFLALSGPAIDRDADSLPEDGDPEDRQSSD